ncbi:hypothetical protein A3K78_01920 [Candidatus Bathyarchaeota archaeon RBG_13_52_12]|nr:MAG: hypothetical protein A3K78_01920 [Candidatus Bathyarchaeota archaeon RBG_13_52_12]
MEKQQLITKLREKGFKVTPQRIDICRFILSSKEHPTADRVYQEMLRKHPTISIATVYQTLHLLNKIGLIEEMGSSVGISRYDPNTSPHINIICKNCGKIRDYEEESVRELWSQIITKLKVTPVGQHLEVYIYCDKCKELGT